MSSVLLGGKGLLCTHCSTSSRFTPPWLATFRYDCKTKCKSCTCVPYKYNTDYFSTCECCRICRDVTSQRITSQSEIDKLCDSLPNSEIRLYVLSCLSAYLSDRTLPTSHQFDRCRICKYILYHTFERELSCNIKVVRSTSIKHIHTMCK